MISKMVFLQLKGWVTRQIGAPSKVWEKFLLRVYTYVFASISGEMIQAQYQHIEALMPLLGPHEAKRKRPPREGVDLEQSPRELTL